MSNSIRIRAKFRALPRIAVKLLHFGVPRQLLLFGPLSIGDDLLCTAIARELVRRGKPRPWMMSNHPQLFSNNRDVERVIPVDDYHASSLSRLGTLVSQPYYFGQSADGRHYIPPSRPIIAEMCALAGITGEVQLRPWLHLTPQERVAGKLCERQIVIHSSGLAARSAMANKEWFYDRFQMVADGLSEHSNVVQLGSAGDPALRGVLDLRGKTTLRESAAIVASARVVVCQVGFLMHLARAVDTRAVVIFGGVEHPAISGYSANENLYSPVECAPCWMPNNCPHDHKCMRAIAPAEVLAAVLRCEERFGESLSVDSCNVERPSP